MYESSPTSAALFVYGLLAAGLLCSLVVALSVARDARRKRTARRQRKS